MESAAEFVAPPTVLLSVSFTTSSKRKRLSRTRAVYGLSAVKPRSPSLMTCVWGVPPRAPPYHSSTHVVRGSSFASFSNIQWRIS